jgi:sirohydrochlorin cobaltochelatase
MKACTALFGISGLIIFIWTGFAFGHGPTLRGFSGDIRPDKAGVLVIALVPKDAREFVKLNALNKNIQAALPNTDINWSFLSADMSVGEAFELAQEGLTPKNVLAQMERENITHVAVLPLYIIPGEEYAHLAMIVETLKRMPTKFRKTTLAEPFFGAPENVLQVCQAVVKSLPKRSRKDEAAVIFFQETSPLGQYVYPGIQYYFWKLDESVLVATTAGTPGLSDVTAHLKKLKAKTVHLVPFVPYTSPGLMRLKSGLEAQGYRVRLSKGSIVDHSAVQNVVVKHLMIAVDALGL